MKLTGFLFVSKLEDSPVRKQMLNDFTSLIKTLPGSVSLVELFLINIQKKLHKSLNSG